MKTTASMTRALEIAKRDGTVFAGYSTDKGCRFYVSAATITALVKRGALEAIISTDGGYAARLPAVK